MDRGVNFERKPSPFLSLVVHYKKRPDPNRGGGGGGGVDREGANFAVRV